MSVNDVMTEVLTDRVFYDESGGGVTFSGGEPLAQPRFLHALLQASRDHRLHTAVDTSGFAGTECLLALAGLADLFLYDLKLMDDAKHRHYCGVPVGPVLANLQALARAQANLWIRIPIIPGVNDGPADLEALAEFIATLQPTPPVSLLPYHATGAQKFRRLGLEYRLDAIHPPSPAMMDALREQFRARGVIARVGA
jgi:pyruvate formate lyase activating enzyme